MLKWLVGALLSPLTKLGEKYIQSTTDKDKLKAGVTEAAYAADAAVRKVKLSYFLLRLPLFIAEFSCAVYIGAIMADSTYPMTWLTPLELPDWFKPHFYIMVASVFGLSTVERIGRRK